ncbi:hypothetical protein [Streptomyces chartreusis]|uniref:hypothetical protein n=1 Tax=Streptomyces chartreusis TaxID=1969 RepID=UPI0036382252
MTVALERPASTGTRDPQELLNAVAPHITELTLNVFDSGMSLWDREIALLLRDHTMVRDMAEELWAIDGADCSPCDNKVSDSH